MYSLRETVITFYKIGVVVLVSFCKDYFAWFSIYVVSMTMYKEVCLCLRDISD
jgi:hypothetical protein